MNKTVITATLLAAFAAIALSMAGQAEPNQADMTCANHLTVVKADLDEARAETKMDIDLMRYDAAKMAQHAGNENRCLSELESTTTALQ
jgi:hypothetical protein